MTLMTRVLTSAALVTVLSGGLVACGDDDPTTAAEGPSTGASTADFCAALGDVAAAYGSVAPDDLAAKDVQAIKGTVAELVEVGTPEDMPDDARAGFVLVTSEVLALADDVTVDELEQAGEDFSGADEENADAFDDYVDQTCDGASGEDE